MPTHDKQGRPYLKISEAKPGQKIICDGGFTCMDPFETTRLARDLTTGGLYFICADGYHYLSGQADDDEHCVGLYPT